VADLARELRDLLDHGRTVATRASTTPRRASVSASPARPTGALRSRASSSSGDVRPL
jgi:hypothetical protein